MDYKELKKSLSDYPENQVNKYCRYIERLVTEKQRGSSALKYPWAGKTTVSNYAFMFESVASDGLILDGEMITLQYKGKLMVSYNYQAYKNKLLLAYPETKIDLQLVHKNDLFSFKKDSGHVIYTHEIIDPFNVKKEIIGAYCIIKNSRGEFIETLNMTEVEKMKAVAKTKYIWDAWEGEMILKSVIKRACKRHFNDIIVESERLDNENYDLDAVNVTSELEEAIGNVNNFEDLNAVWMRFKTSVKEIDLMKALNEKKDELEKEIADANS